MEDDNDDPHEAVRLDEIPLRVRPVFEPPVWRFVVAPGGYSVVGPENPEVPDEEWL